MIFSHMAILTAVQLRHAGEFFVFEHIEKVFSIFVSYSIIAVEAVGVSALIVAVVNGIVGFFKKDRNLRLKLAEGIVLSLEFKMGSELLRTVIVRDFSELGILGAVIILRGTLSFLIHMEIKNEKEYFK